MKGKSWERWLGAGGGGVIRDRVDKRLGRKKGHNPQKPSTGTGTGYPTNISKGETSPRKNNAPSTTRNPATITKISRVSGELGC